MNSIVNWIKGIAIFYIAASLLINLVPDNKYKKYIKTFLGFLMIILIIRPVGDFMKTSDNFKSLFTINTNNQLSQEIKSEMKLAGESRKEIILKDYKEKLKKSINEKLKEYSTEIKSFNIGIDDEGNLIKMELTVSDIDNLQKIEIKKYISDFYNLKERNIYVNISD